MIKAKKLQTLAPFWAFCVLLTWWVSEHSFFWDTVQLASKHAHWYYDQQFARFFLPENINSGHPPLFGMYLAACWTLFGKSLIVSHFSILPFLLGIIWQLEKIGTHFGKKSTAKYLILLVLVDPFFAGQSILVSPDIVLVFAFLLSLNGILEEKNWTVMMGTILLGMISMRGMMVAFSLYLWWVFISIFRQNINHLNSWEVFLIFIKKASLFLPAGLLSLAFLGYHYHEFSWIGYHPNSPWAASFERVGLGGFFKNIGLLIWRYLDFGRLFLLGGLGWLFLQIPKTDKEDWGLKLLSLFGFLFLLLTPSLLLHKGLMSHRYLLPMTLTLTFLFYHLLSHIIADERTQKIIYAIAFLGLLTGNLWVYPKQIAQGWDATLAHLPFYETRNKMIDFVDNSNIPYNEIGTVFPNIGPLEIYDLNGRKEGFVKKDLPKNRYFLYSTVFNDLTDAELEDLSKNWQVVKTIKSFNLEIILYEQSVQ